MKKVLFLLLLFSVALIPQSNNRFKKISSGNTLTVGINNDYQPFYLDENSSEYPGFDIEFARLYAEYLGVNLKIVVLDDLNDLFASVKNGKVDIGLGGVSANLERGKEVSFSKAYLYSSPAGLIARSMLQHENEGDIVQSKNFENINDLKDIASLVFCVKAGTTNQYYLKRFFQKSDIQTFNTNELALKAFLENSCNVFTADNLYIEALMQSKPELKVSYHPLLGSVIEQSIAVVIPKNDTVIAFDLNFFIYELKKTGVIKELKSKYFNDDKWIKKDSQ